MSQKFAKSKNEDEQKIAAALGHVAMKTMSYSAMVSNLIADLTYDSIVMNGSGTVKERIEKNGVGVLYEGTHAGEQYRTLTSEEYKEILLDTDGVEIERLDQKIRKRLKDKKLNYTRDTAFLNIVMVCDAYENFLRNAQVPPCVTEEQQIIYTEKIKELSNIDLPDEPYSEEKIIKVVCTNIYDFTTLKIDGVHITDESTLLKYFTNPFVEFYSKGKDATQLIDADFIWAEGRPTVGEFLKYLDKPVTVGKIPECFEDEFKIIPAFEGDYFIGFKDVILAKDPYREAINERRQIIKAKKIYPNDPCICGSGKKYKKCCGK